MSVFGEIPHDNLCISRYTFSTYENKIVLEFFISDLNLIYSEVINNFVTE